MNPISIEELRARFQAKSTEELLQIWKENDRSTYREETFKVIRQILVDRESDIQPQLQPPMVDDVANQMRRCPYCAESIQAAAIKCRYCGESLLSNSKSANPTKWSPIGIAAVVLGIGGVLLPYFASVFLVPAALICGLVALRHHQRSMGWAGIVLGIIGAAGIIYTSQKISNLVRDPFSASLPESSSPIVTKAEYDQIDDGMTYEAVLAIIGSEGEELSRSDLAGITTVMYSWKNSNGSNMNAVFQDQRLVNKAQFGLR